MPDQEVKIIALTGPSAAGKTTLGDYLSRQFNYEFEHIRIDDYLKNPKTFDVNERGHRIWEDPKNVQFDILISHLKKLKNRQIADWHTFAKDETEQVYYYTLHPKPYILVEGTMVLMNEDVNSMADLKIYLDVPLDVSLARRAERGRRELGFDLSEYDKEMMVPFLEKHRQVQRFHTDYIVDGTKDIKAVAEEVRSIIGNSLENNENENNIRASYMNE